MFYKLYKSLGSFFFSHLIVINNGYTLKRFTSVCLHIRLFESDYK